MSVSIEQTVNELLKARRRRAHAWLKGWARERERIGAGALGPVAKIREYGDGAGSRSSTLPGEPNGIESQCDKLERTIRVERFVRMMPREWVLVLVAYYLDDQPQEAVAKQLGIERYRVVCRLQDAQDRLAAEFEAEDVARVMEMSRAFDRVTVEQKPVVLWLKAGGAVSSSVVGEPYFPPVAGRTAKATEQG